MEGGKRRSRILARAGNIKKLLYVASAITNTVYVYNYKTGALVGIVDYWAYPSGGSPTSVIRAPDTVVFGSVVSIKE
jgi:hypothetical protein